MKNILALTKRNCLLYLRDKQVVFFSFFSSAMLIVLYFLFISKLYADGFNEMAGLELTSRQINFAIYSQMIMGVIVLNSVSMSTGMFTFMARDFETRKTDALMLTKVKPSQIMMSYLISALIVSFILNFLMLFASFIIIGATSFWWNASTFFAIVGVLILTTIVSCSIMLLITTLIRSSAAIGVINGILGTILGFLCGIYMPYANLGKAATYVGSFLPFTHLTVWLKQIVLNDVFTQFGMSSEVANGMRFWFSADNVGLCGTNIPLWGMILLSVGIALVCFGISIFILVRKLGKSKNTK